MSCPSGYRKMSSIPCISAHPGPTVGLNVSLISYSRYVCDLEYLLVIEWCLGEILESRYVLRQFCQVDLEFFVGSIFW